MMLVVLLSAIILGQKPGIEVLEKVTVKFSKHENGMVVKALINNHGPFPFILDTGAAMTVISSPAAAKAGLRPNGEDIMLVGVGGRPVRGQLTQIRELSLGGAKARRMDVVIYEIPQLTKANIAGLIGQDFLERFDLNFNNRKKMLTLSLPGTVKPKPAPKKPLGLMEQLARKVYADPSSPFQDFHEITRRAQNYYNLCATGAPPQLEDLEDFEALLYHNRQRMSQLYTHLLNLPFHELEPEWNANVQKFLYCWPDYRRYIEQAESLAQQLRVGDVIWENAASKIESITEIASRFGCKPPIAQPAWLDSEDEN